MFNTVAAEVSRLLKTDVALIGRYETDSSFTYLATVGVPSDPSAPTKFVLGGNNLATNIARSGRSQSMIYHAATGSIAAYARRLDLRSAIGTPIIVDGRIWGAMLAGWTRTEQVSPGALQRIEAITELVATTIANAESRAALIESRARVVAAGDESRRRIERDLHDGAQQRLVTIALKLRSHGKGAVPEVGKLLEEVASDIEEVLDELRELAAGLCPPMLAAGGLGPALRGLARRAPIPVRLAIDVADRQPEQIEVAAYYVVAEALTNVAKHAHASVAEVAVTATAQALTVRVADDGVGGADFGKGSGLMGLRDRVEAVGGTMSLSDALGGTAVVATLPIGRGNPGPQLPPRAELGSHRMCGK